MTTEEAIKIADALTMAIQSRNPPAEIVTQMNKLFPNFIWMWHFNHNSITVIKNSAGESNDK